MKVNNLANTIMDSKLAELKKFLPFLLMAPYTRAILLAGSVAVGNPKPTSDIDLIIVSQNNRVWLNRFFLEILTRILRIRRIKNNFNNKICFNISLSNREPLLPHQDAIGAGFYKNIKPVWGDQTEIKKFWEKNSWIKNFEKSGDDRLENLIPNKNCPLTKTIAEKILDYSGAGLLLEKISYVLQARYLRKKFNRAVADKNSLDFDFNIAPHLIAYHFPVSNHARAKKHDRATVENNSAPEK